VEFPVKSPHVSVIVTTHNEGEELHHTLRSIVDNTNCLAEILVVDDGSTDGSCDSVGSDIVRVIRHDTRVGVARSRDEASRAARGNVLCYLDAHQRLSPKCVDRCAQVALDEHAITCPDIRDFGRFEWRLYGAHFRLCPKRGYFSARWRHWRILRRVKPVTGLRAPPYLIPSDLYPKVGWHQSLRGWGGSEAAVAVKAFFTNTRILHVGGPLALHKFRRRFHYETSWEGVWRNHAVIARVCFDDNTWFRYWLPNVFEPHLDDIAKKVLASTDLEAEQRAFQSIKVRPDRDFWTCLLRQTVPVGV